MKPQTDIALPSRPRKVAIAIEMHYTAPWHLEVSQGIMHYGDQHGWVYTIDPYLLSLPVSAVAQVDGVIGRLNSEIYRAMEGLDLPAVNVLGSNYVKYLEQVPSLKINMSRMLELAMQHLIVCGFQQIGFIGVKRLPSNDKKLAFITELLSSHSLASPASLVLPGDFEDKRESTLDVINQLTKWLEQVKKPIGLLVQDATIPILLGPLCKELGLRVPQDVGYVGLSGDEMISLNSTPTLSYVYSNYFEHGYQAAAMLDRLMAGEEMNTKHKLFSPERVIVRESSDVFMCEDPLVSEAMRHIAKHIRQNPSIDDVAGHLGISRRKLERHFTGALGRTIQHEIKRLRIDSIKRLVRETDRSLPTIAEDYKFSSVGYMSKYFKDAEGVTPAAFRKQHKK